jgi:hypothetical protein
MSVSRMCIFKLSPNSGPTGGKATYSVSFVAVGSTQVRSVASLFAVEFAGTAIAIR